MKARFSHVMNDNSTGITFLYFNGGSIQALNDRDVDHDYLSEFCVHMDSQDHKKLEAALRLEPYDCTSFNEEEMKCIKNICKRIYPKPEEDKWIKPASMTDSEWEAFLEKLQ